MQEFPTHPDEVTRDWLSELLGVTVSNVRWEPIGTGQVGDSVRFHLGYEGGKGPATLAGKFPAADATSRATAAMFGLYAKEVEFYRSFAPLIDVRAPRTHFADVSPDGTDFALIFEDLGPARGGDQIAGCDMEDARRAIRQAAAIHAPSWSNKDILDAEWVKPPPGLGAQIGSLYPQAHAKFSERYADLLEPQYMALCDEFAEASEHWFVRDDEPQCLVHGDFRLDNMLFDIRGGEEEIAILDWQTVTVGKAMTDVGYFLGCGIGEELRLAGESELLRLYVDEMRARGVSLSMDDIWHDYRLGALHGLSTAVFSAAFVERTSRGDRNFLSMARGACSLALAHNSLGALKGED